MSLGKTQSNVPNFTKESANSFQASSSQNEGTTIYGKQLNQNGVALVIDNEGIEHDIWVKKTDKIDKDKTDKKDYFRVNSRTKAFQENPVTLREAEQIIKSWDNEFKAQGIKPESQKPKFVAK